MEDTKHTSILLIGGNGALVYLIERYARQRGLLVYAERIPSATMIAFLQPAVVWFMSFESLAATHPRATGLLNENTPMIVCSSIMDDIQMREFGADYCALHPLTYAGFLDALAAVGVLSSEGLQHS
ncbi:MAG TPA: hypothetical protein PKA05_07825 [Roseiflexaceae bacterium]|nr:hypothetical protein [Roseiflexaceae bacterium]HMP40273.1 hypothetical protein [Roseiflexaceae bacterium]